MHDGLTSFGGSPLHQPAPMPGHDLPDLSIIIVNWNVHDLLRDCLMAIQRSPGVVLAEAQQGGEAAQHLPPSHPLQPAITAEVIVVDNASSDGSAEMVATQFPWVRLIANPDNRGFAAANNQGLAISRGRYVLFLNPDTVVVDDALRALVHYMDLHPEAGAVGPLLRYGDGSLQPSCRRFPTLTIALFESTPIAWHWPDNPWARHYRMADLQEPTAGVQEVDWLVGAALLVRREALDQVEGFDEGYFMYSEELDLCRRLKEAGWRIFYLPFAQVIHYEGRSSEQAIAARHIRFQASKVRYFRKFHGPLAAELLRGFLLAAFAAEWLLEGSKWLLGSRRSLRRQRMAAYGQLLRTKLRENRISG